jgi:hypothetical protein
MQSNKMNAWNKLFIEGYFYSITGNLFNFNNALVSKVISLARLFL